MNALKLELCVGILQVLQDKGQLSATSIATKVKIDCNLLEKCTKLLVEQGMVKKTDHSNLVVYEITEGGKKVLRFFMLDNSPKTDKTLNSARLVKHAPALNRFKR